MMHAAADRWRSVPSAWTPTAAVVTLVVALLSGVISAQDTYGAGQSPSSTVAPSDQPAYSQLGQSSPSPLPVSSTPSPAAVPAATTAAIPVTSQPAPTPIISNDINAGLTSPVATSTPGITPGNFGLPPNLNFSSRMDSTSGFDTSAVYGPPPDAQSAYGPESPLSGGGVNYQQQAERRTFDMGGGGLASGLTSILTPIAGAAAAALTAGGGASLLSLPNANIQPTLQKTFVLNLGPHNPPLIVQGNAFQPGASAGATINNHGRGGGGGGGGYRAQQRHYQPQQQQQQPQAAASTQLAQERGGYVAYPNSPNLPSIAGKLGIANLLSLAKQSGFLENLLIGGPFTFFAPSDEAFGKLPKIFMSRAAENPELLKQMLLYHLVPDTITTRHFTNDLVVPTLNTLKVRINLYQLGYKKIATVNGAVITRADQYIINGVIHVIDRVLFPPANGSILHIINAPNCQPFDVISTVLAIAGLYDKLSEDGPFTVFLPNTESFGAIPKENRDALLANATLIKEAFLYHIVPGVYYSQGLVDNQWLETLSSFGVPLQVGMVSDGGSRRFDSINGAVRIVKADIPATNGVVHIVDKIITPFQTYLTCLDT